MNGRPGRSNNLLHIHRRAGLNIPLNMDRFEFGEVEVVRNAGEINKPLPQGNGRWELKIGRYCIQQSDADPSVTS